MPTAASRRDFLRLAATGGALASVGGDVWRSLPRVSAQEAQPAPQTVQFSPEIEPLVQLIEETPAERLLEEVAARIRGGAAYRDVVAALLLAGIRNVQPRPAVGFKFHAVLVVNSAHLASLASPDEHRWLPIFWALDYFKSAQAQDVREGNWTMPAVEESRVPPPHLARAQFIEAMDKWDEAAADVAAASLARSASSHELFDLFCRYGARDYRSIGHKAIYVANAWRTLHCIGWQHAEPVLRSLAYALLNHQGEGNPAENDFAADRPGRENRERVGGIRSDWESGRLDDAATTSLLAELRTGTPASAAELVVELLNGGVGPQSIWNALLTGSGELLMRQPGIVGLHTLTTSNALRYAYGTAAARETRLLMLLQNASFLPMFRESMVQRGKVRDVQLDQLAPVEDAAAATDPAAILAAISQDRDDAARRVLAYVDGQADVSPLLDQARLLVFFKGRDSHDYKFSSAVLEDYLQLTPAWRGRFLAASVFNLRGSGERDNPLADRARQALAG